MGSLHLGQKMSPAMSRYRNMYKEYLQVNKNQAGLLLAFGVELMRP